MFVHTKYFVIEQLFEYKEDIFGSFKQTRI